MSRTTQSRNDDACSLAYPSPSVGFADLNRRPAEPVGGENRSPEVWFFEKTECLYNYETVIFRRILVIRSESAKGVPNPFVRMTGF
jgi:hypothetical protein